MTRFQRVPGTIFDRNSFYLKHFCNDNADEPGKRSRPPSQWLVACCLVAALVESGWRLRRRGNDRCQTRTLLATWKATLSAVFVGWRPLGIGMLSRILPDTSSTAVKSWPRWPHLTEPYPVRGLVQATTAPPVVTPTSEGHTLCNSRPSWRT